MPVQQSEVLINNGLHQFQRGRIESIDTTTEIPFARIALRGSKGQILKRSAALVPLKYCQEIDQAAEKLMRAALKAIRKQRRQEAQARAVAQTEIAATPLDWG